MVAKPAGWKSGDAGSMLRLMLHTWWGAVMSVIKWFLIVGFTVSWGIALAQPDDAQSLLRECQEKKIRSWEGVTHYVVVQSVMGHRVASAFERFEAPGPDGRMYPAFRPAPEAGGMSSDELRAFGDASQQVGDALSEEIKAAGFPAFLMAGSKDEPWASPDPGVMMGTNAAVLYAAADGQEEMAEERQAAVGEASQSMSDELAFARQAVLLGVEPVEQPLAGGGAGRRDAYHLQAEGLNHVASAEEGQEMVVHAVDLWIDTRECVPLKMTMAGVVNAEGESRPLTIETIMSEYRGVAGSAMYEPHRQVVRMKGMMTAEQEREMRHAQKELKEAEQQIAQLPAGQREMIMAQMGPQMEMMRSMASGGGFEMVTETEAIVVNADKAALQQLQSTLPAAPGMGMASMPGHAPSATAPAAASPATDELRSAQRTCLEEKIQQRREAGKKKRGFGKLLGAVSRVAGRAGAPEVSKALGDAYSANATAEDLASAARDLGLTEDEVAECQGPR